MSLAEFPYAIAFASFLTGAAFAFRRPRSRTTFGVMAAALAVA